MEVHVETLPFLSRLPRLTGRRELHAWFPVTPAVRGTRQIPSQRSRHAMSPRSPPADAPPVCQLPLAGEAVAIKKPRDVKGVDAGLNKIRGRDPLRHRRSRASPLRRPHDRSSCACGRLFVRSEKSNALVGGGFPRLRPARSANLDSAFGGMQLFATEAWRAAPLLLTHSAQLTQPTVRLPQL